MTEILTIPAKRSIKPIYIRELVLRRSGQKRAMVNPQAFEVDILPLSASDGGGFTAVAPDLPGCRSDGETPQEALANIYDAITCWIEAAKDAGRAIPQPRRAAA